MKMLANGQIIPPFFHVEYSLRRTGCLEYRHREYEVSPKRPHFHCPPFGGRSPGLNRILSTGSDLYPVCQRRLRDTQKRSMCLQRFCEHIGGMDGTPPQLALALINRDPFLGNEIRLLRCAMLLETLPISPRTISISINTRQAWLPSSQPT
jgi:hypothetical protein